MLHTSNLLHSWLAGYLCQSLGRDDKVVVDTRVYLSQQIKFENVL
ncbi:hypothetical protein Pecwa_2368 [Pectobacterium parmentieri WPP163]|nr:hypothetical protein Pecwa_2368 [Pectobacterium parmentieri WPP163]